jgi:S1-C subfamily serine protease
MKLFAQLSVALTVIILSALTASLFLNPQNTLRKELTNEELFKKSVMITNRKINSGGSGVVLRSYPEQSVILTNEHVCDLTTKGGFVFHGNNRHVVRAFKKDTEHDLCLVLVYSNLGVNTNLASAAASINDEVIVVGHPALLPEIITKGHPSSNMIAPIMVGFKNMAPVFREYETTVFSNTIIPGSSGSPVLNSKGELVAVVFASMSRELSYALAVPYNYVKKFLQTEQLTKYTRISYDVVQETEEDDDAAFDFEACKANNIRFGCPLIRNIEYDK